MHRLNFTLFKIVTLVKSIAGFKSSPHVQEFVFLINNRDSLPVWKFVLFYFCPYWHILHTHTVCLPMLFLWNLAVANFWTVSLAAIYKLWKHAKFCLGSTMVKTKSFSTVLFLIIINLRKSSFLYRHPALCRIRSGESITGHLACKLNWHVMLSTRHILTLYI